MVMDFFFYKAQHNGYKNDAYTIMPFKQIQVERLT